jgi:ATP-dependent helicase/nuclease subunit B
MNLAAFPPDAAFLPALAAAWLAASGDVADGLILLPNRRAARALAGAFLQANGGKALLLPRITALSALDETALALAGLDLPPAIQPLRRQALLAQLILKLDGANGAPSNLPSAWALAADLAALLDEADFAGINLATALPGVVAAELAAHWQTTLDFLQILTHAWPKILAAEGALNQAARHAKLLDAQREAWTKNPPPGKIWLVAREADPATARLARTIAALPNGLLIFPGYDDKLPDEAWDALEDSHPQAGIAHLLGAIGARREEILLLPATSKVPTGRVKLLSRALLPAASLAAWQNPTLLDTTGISRLAAQDEEQNATAIAMVLRDALETPGRTAALITPDRALATRVAATLKRFGISADDSAGEPLGSTPPAILLRLLARAAASEFAPLPLLALLKHPLAAAGLPPGRCRELARALERAALRGPRPPPGLEGIRFRLNNPKYRVEADFLTRLERILAPISLPESGNPATALRALLAAAESLAGTAQDSGAAILWSGEAGAALSEHLLEALAAVEPLPDMPAARLADLLDALLAGQVIRRPRAKDGHPRVAIWGVQEAALQSVDVAVLGGLNETVWPAMPDPGPWLSRPMRKAAGLAAPEQQIGAAAHDFFALAASCPTVILAAPKRRDRAPAVPSRWITRLEAMLAGAGQTLPVHPAASWAAQLDMPTARLTRPKPKPLPPAYLRPTTLSISDIATLIADPYAIYARKILGVTKLPALDEESDQSLFGNIVHAGLETFFTLDRDFTAPTATAELTTMLQNAMREERPRAALQHWWEARLERIAAWIVSAEQQRRASNPPVKIAVEVESTLPVPGGFTLKGRADRIEKRADGSVFIMDYKTGSPPSADQVRYGSAPQLPLEAVMAEAGAFGPDFCAPVTELAFWRLSGRHEPGEDKPLFDKKPDELRDVIDQAASNLPALFARFADPATPYLAKPHPSRQTYEDTYAGISRAGEWGGGEDDGS